MLVIPTKVGEENPNFDFRVTLEGTEYEFRLRYNERDETWSVSIYDSAGSPIRLGMRTVENFPVLRQVADSRKPPGLMYFYDTRTLSAPPGIEGLGPDGTVRLIYDESED